MAFDFPKALFAGALCIALAGCVHTAVKQQMSKQEVFALVSSLPNSREKAVALAIINHATTRFRIDQHGYPAWTWRGEDDIGGCIHIRPQTRLPYLENQYPRTLRTSVPKYIDFATDGADWQCRIHTVVLGQESEKNWSTPQCHQEGVKLVGLLQSALSQK